MAQKSYKYDLVGLGNALVDTVALVEEDFLSARGLVKDRTVLVEHKAMEKLKSQVQDHAKTCGGSIVNSLVTASSLGLSCALVGKVGDDLDGETFCNNLLHHGIDFMGAKDTNPLQHTGSCLVLVTPDKQRSMATFLGCASAVKTEDLDKKALQDTAVLFMEGYLWESQQARKVFYAASAFVKQGHGAVALSLSDVLFVERHREDFLRALQEGIVDIVFSNEDELLSLYQTENLPDALAALPSKVLCLCTRGDKGALIATQGKVMEIPAITLAQVVDVTGAGDAFAAGFLSGYIKNRHLYDSGVMGSLAAGEVINHYGPRSPAPIADFIRKNLARYAKSAAKDF